MNIEPITMRDMLRYRVRSQMATVAECKRRIAAAEAEMGAAKRAARQINQQISEIDNQRKEP